MTADPHLSVFAPAKLNLFLHVTGKRDDGYHLLDSLVCFTDIGDHLTLRDSESLQIHVEGPFANSFTSCEKDVSRASQNLIIKAVWMLADRLNKDPNLAITLHKNLPLGGGIGGGSSNAAAIIWALLKYWNIQSSPAFLSELLLALGADVPVCYKCEATQMQGIGDILNKAPKGIPELPVLLVNPSCPSSTHDVFSGFNQADFMQPIAMPEQFKGQADFIAFLNETHNALTHAAVNATPQIQEVLNVLGKQNDILLHRMSGSGSTCFGLFSDMQSALDAAETISIAHPTWWVRTGTLNTPKRY